MKKEEVRKTLASILGHIYNPRYDIETLKKYIGELWEESYELQDTEEVKQDTNIEDKWDYICSELGVLEDEKKKKVLKDFIQDLSDREVVPSEFSKEELVMIKRWGDACFSEFNAFTLMKDEDFGDPGSNMDLLDKIKLLLESK
jgi:hypothetical protein